MRSGSAGLLPEVSRWAQELEGLGLPDNLVHNDLHANNVFATREGMRFFDFGDAVLPTRCRRSSSPSTRCSTASRRHRRIAPARVADAGLRGVGRCRAGCRPPAERCPRRCISVGWGGESWLRVTATMTPREELVEFGDAGSWWLAALGDPPPVTPAVTALTRGDLAGLRVLLVAEAPQLDGLHDPVGAEQHEDDDLGHEHPQSEAGDRQVQHDGEGQQHSEGDRQRGRCVGKRLPWPAPARWLRAARRPARRCTP